MTKVKKGDRVRMISHDKRVPYGTIGTVLEYDKVARVLAPPEEALPVEPEETLRDRMAMTVLAGFNPHPAIGHKPDFVAKYCYEIADAMLKERAGK